MQAIGSDGNSDGDTVVEKVVHSIISPPYLKDISWTGKGKGKERKVALSRFNHVIDFIKSITLKAAKTFTEEDFKDRLIYGILKRAPAKYGSATKTDDKENVNKSSPTKSKESNNNIESSTSNSTPTAALQVHQPNHQANQLPSYRTPIVEPLYQQQGFVQPPITHYPPPPPHPFGHSQQQQPYYNNYHQQTNFNRPLDNQWQPPNAGQPDHGHSSTYFQL